MIIHKIEDLLCEIHKQDYCCLTGNATSGIILGLESAGIKKGSKVAIPNNVCFNIPLAVLLSGNEPLYLDIDPTDMGIDIKELEKYINEVSAVIAVHAYGSVCNISEISQICKIKGVFLIEDFCVAQGGFTQGLPVGSFGDLSIVSFSTGKIIDIGHGGAILTKDKEIHATIRKHAEKLDDYSFHGDKIRALSDLHTKIYNEQYPIGIHKFATEFKSIALKSRNSFFYKFKEDYAQNLKREIDLIHENISRRKKNSLFLFNFFSREEYRDIFYCFQYSEGSVPWRFNIFVDPINRDYIFKSLLKKNIKISSWFPSVDIFFESSRNGCRFTKSSDDIGDRIINFWVNQDVDDTYFDVLKNEIESLIKNVQYLKSE